MHSKFTVNVMLLRVIGNDGVVIPYLFFSRGWRVDGAGYNGGGGYSGLIINRDGGWIKGTKTDSVRRSVSKIPEFLFFILSENEYF